ncbi:unnamed protein product, partial [Musa acuminata subsp. malaccensis]
WRGEHGRGKRSGEAVVAEGELPESGEVCEGGGDAAGELVGVEEEVFKAGEAAEGGWNGAGELLEVAEIEQPEGEEVAEGRRETPGNGGVGDEVGPGEEARAGDVDDAASGSVAGHAVPRGATVRGRVPGAEEAGGVGGDAGLEGEKGRTVVGVTSLRPLQQQGGAEEEEDEAQRLHVIHLLRERIDEGRQMFSPVEELAMKRRWIKLESKSIRYCHESGSRGSLKRPFPRSFYFFNGLSGRQKCGDAAAN